MPFYFLDYDEKNMEDRDICASDYYDLIDTCFRYCSFFSFSRLPLESDMSNYPVSAIAYLPECKTVTTEKNLLVYECSASANRFLKSYSNSIFSWVNWGDNRNIPEDLTFYRKDKSIFFWSETHEGICILLNRADEDVSSILSRVDWLYFTLPLERTNVWIPNEIMNYRLPLHST